MVFASYILAVDSARRATKAIEVVGAYIQYLKDRGISIGVEFTQTKDRHEQEKAARPAEPGIR